jgi:L-ascorbate metabolism protein UlaG (beta-lactamase superfamily)
VILIVKEEYMKKYIICMMAIMVLLQGCSKTDNTNELISDNNPEVDTKKDEDTDSTADTTADIPEPTSAPTPEPDLILPQATNDSGKVRIQTASKSIAYPYNSYIISSVNGENVVLDPTEMPKKDVVDFSPAAIISTHSHPDHVDNAFSKAYECQKLNFSKGEIQTDDFHIYTILSSHNGDVIKESNQNVIVVLEVDGLRIAHMGDIGQTELTEEQLTELGDIDIAFMQFENSYSGMSLENEKGFNLIEQLNPTIVVPTHYTSDAVSVLEEKYGAITEVLNSLEITKEELHEGSLNVYIIKNEYKFR